MINFLTLRLKFLPCFVVLQFASADPNSCNINLLNGLHPDRAPMILCGTEIEYNDKYMHPLLKDPENIIIEKNSKFKVHCPHNLGSNFQNLDTGGEVKLNNNNQLVTAGTFKPVFVTCNGNDQYSIGSIDVQLNELNCETKNQPSIRTMFNTFNNNKKCGPQDSGIIIKISYKVDTAQFLDIITLCHDTNSAKTYWAYGIMKAVKNKKVISDIDNIAYKKGSQFTVANTFDEDDPYIIKNQRAAFVKLVTESNVDQYIKEDTVHKMYVSRGELISHNDLFYHDEQLASFSLLNIQPIWEKIRLGNWDKMEKYIRKLTEIKKREFEIWSGGIDESKYNKGSGKKEPIYLAKGENKIPIPSLIYKCAIDKKVEEGICFLIVNDQYSKVKARQSFINSGTIKCNDLIDTRCPILFTQDATNGFTFCCTPSAFYDSYNTDYLGLNGFEKYRGYISMELHDPNDDSKILL